MQLPTVETADDLALLAGFCGGWAKVAYKEVGDLELVGSLYYDKQGDRITLSIPSYLIAGLFGAIGESGWQLPEKHVRSGITVIGETELDKLGGPSIITERGKQFSYSIRPPKIVQLNGANGLEKACVLVVASPQLQKLRKSYGLSGPPEEGESKFYAVIAVKQQQPTKPAGPLVRPASESAVYHAR